MVLEAYAAHLPVVFAHGVVVARDTHAEVAFVLAQLVGRGGVVAQPGQLEAERRLPVAQVDQHEASVGGLLASDLLETECLGVELQAAVEVGDIDVEMIESALYFHCCLAFTGHKFT